MNLETSTAHWSLVIHRVSDSSAEIWAGTLFPELKKPKTAKIVITLPDGSVRRKNITTRDWKRPFAKVNQRFYALCTFTNLKSGCHYTVRFSRRIEALQGVIKQKWQTVRTGQFDTLPARIPLKGSKRFTIALGSCFYNHRDGGNAAESYKALYERGGEKVRPDITFLSGDQVYLDIGFDSLSLRPDEIRQRIANDYATHWQALGAILNRGGTWMLPDDHEYWNDYPFYQSNIPTLQALRIKTVREAWNAAARDGVKNIQRSPTAESFSIGGDLSICVADFRTFRSEKRFAPKSVFQHVTNWARTLKSPGVLVVPQPLIVEENPAEKNLRSYPHQYQQLIASLAHTGHDIVLMSGDVHFGRIASTPLGMNGARLIEVIASPLSNLTGLNGIATAKPKTKPVKFPDNDSAQANGWKPQNVEYCGQAYSVKTTKGFIFSSYPRTRTKEHFMTVSFSRLKTGGLKMWVEAWRVRERSGAKQLPVQDFAKAFKTKLR